jgi:hypothetical protein
MNKKLLDKLIKDKKTPKIKIGKGLKLRDKKKIIKIIGKKYKIKKINLK